MDKVLATKVIDTARFYMSGDNCQPFRYRFNVATQTFHIDYLAAQAKHTFVYDDYTILLTLGSLLEYLDTTLKEYSYSSELAFDFEKFSAYEDKPSICSVAVHAQSTQTAQTNVTSLFNVLKQRFTDRRSYRGPESIDISIEPFNQQLTHSTCKLFTNAATSTLHFFAGCDSSIWLSKSLGKDIMDAVAFDSKSPTGLPWRNLGVKKADTLLIKAIQSHHWLFSVVKYCGARWIMQHTQKKLWLSSKSFLVFSYDLGLSREHKTIACKQMMHTILSLSKNGYVFQPSTMSAEILNTPFKPINIVSSADMQPNKLEQQVQKQREYLGLDIAEEEVQWVLRIGKVDAPLDNTALTNRHLTESLLKFE
jgi:hypothetical protein